MSTTVAEGSVPPYRQGSRRELMMIVFLTLKVVLSTIRLTEVSRNQLPDREPADAFLGKPGHLL